ncbi:hypothetical protein KVR01_009138 [Diaporthe batatas]|uniref:uncharacterized protein n=1 Tax=Diaporthe batatas TaxID=748121 RepID=UPI001D0375BF|nr:uncharacterized protein KVR01_009138 [Diaporthe batatas]KAG8160874.1 hypothetical protein KVR01_009138 [Diaporthe batatas]
MAAPEYTKTQAIVCHQPSGGKRQWALEQVAVAPPSDDEVLVEIVASGICHTDFICGSAPYEDLALGLPSYPRVLGHEGAGYVKSIGSKVTKVRWYCHKFMSINFGGTANGFISSEPAALGQAIGGSFFGQSSFSKLTRVKETSVVRVTELLDDDSELKMLAPLGCGIQTGAGTITDLAMAQPSDMVAIIGLGAVGQAAIMAAKIRGCRTIIAIDRIAARLELARTFGATHTVDTSLLTNGLINEIRAITEGTGTTITVDATGVVSLIQEGVEFTANQGKMILLGVPPMDAGLEIPIVKYMFTGKSILSSMEGGVLPEEYIPNTIRWYRAGRFPVDKLVKFYPAEDFQKAVRDMEDGSVIKPVLIW